jgi:hypothetical protein
MLAALRQYAPLGVLPDLRRLSKTSQRCGANYSSRPATLLVPEQAQNALAVLVCLRKRGDPALRQYLILCEIDIAYIELVLCCKTSDIIEDTKRSHREFLLEFYAI